jgi:hypothetical protein
MRSIVLGFDTYQPLYAAFTRSLYQTLSQCCVGGTLQVFFSCPFVSRPHGFIEPFNQSCLSYLGLAWPFRCFWRAYNKDRSALLWELLQKDQRLTVCAAVALALHDCCSSVLLCLT